MPNRIIFDNKQDQALREREPNRDTHKKTRFNVETESNKYHKTKRNTTTGEEKTTTKNKYIASPQQSRLQFSRTRDIVVLLHSHCVSV